MVDIVIIADAILQMDVIVNGSQNVFLCNMLRNQFVYILADHLCKLRRIAAVLVKNLLQNRIINQFRNAQLLGIAVNKIRDIHHHVGENLDIPLLRLDPHGRNRSVLDGIRHLHRHLVARFRQNLPCLGIHHILCKHMVSDPVSEHQFFIKFISADLCKIISSGVEKHCHNQAFRTLYAERLAGTDLFIQLKQTLLIVLRSVLCKACLNLRFISKKFSDLVVGADTERADQHSDRNLSGSVHTHIENVVGIRLVLQPRTTVRNHSCGEKPFTDLVVSDPIIDAGGTDELAYDNALRTVDHKGACLCHERQITHKDLMLGNLVLFFVNQTNLHLERGCVSGVSLFTFLNRIFDILLAQLKVNKFQT